MLCREEFYNNKDQRQPSQPNQNRGFNSGFGGLFDFGADDDDFLWQGAGIYPSLKSSQSQPEHKESKGDDDGEDPAEPFDVDFISTPVGGGGGGVGGVAGGSGQDNHSPVPFPFFPFGGNFGSVFPFHFGGGESNYKPWWKG